MQQIYIGRYCSSTNISQYYQLADILVGPYFRVNQKHGLLLAGCWQLKTQCPKGGLSTDYTVVLYNIKQSFIKHFF